MRPHPQEQRRYALARTDDPRAGRTRRRIIDALDDLLRSGDQVSVSALCTRAEIGRSTFYTHFATVGDVAVEAIDAVLDDLGSADALRRGTRSMARISITRLGVEEFFSAFRSKRRFFVYALSAPAAEQVRERLILSISAHLRGTILAERPESSAQFIRTAGEFIATGLMGVLLSWLAEPDGRSDDDLARCVVDLLPGWMTGENR